MRIKDILEDFSRNEELNRQKMQDDEAKTRQKIERHIQDISQCFEAVILPAVYFSVTSVSSWWMTFWKNLSGAPLICILRTGF
ncbi:MAG: hypothetical protein NTU74_08835 [Deltaproteobacteria bacterium]|nr:hypothetical protein [Deltaproteobacteria bacterium]